MLLAEPSFDVPFVRTLTNESGVQVAAPTQVVVDLMTGPGRGPQEAEELLEWMMRNEQSGEPDLAPDDLLVRSRSVMLDALEALALHRDAVIVIGAQAVYLRTGARRLLLLRQPRTATSPWIREDWATTRGSRRR